MKHVRSGFGRNKDAVKSRYYIDPEIVQNGTPAQVRAALDTCGQMPVQKAMIVPPQAAFKTLVVQASSSGFDGKNVATVTINDKPVEMEENESQHYRGLHIVVINPKDGAIV